jgi:hypothetical protein
MRYLLFILLVFLFGYLLSLDLPRKKKKETPEQKKQRQYNKCKEDMMRRGGMQNYK